MTTPTRATTNPSVLEDLLEIFIAPAAVFERRRETPAFGLALIILTLLIVGLGFVFKDLMSPVFDAEFARNSALAIKQNPQITPEMMAQGKAVAEKFMLVGVAFYALVAPLLMGVVLWFMGKFLESKAEIGQLMMVATYAFFPRVIEAVVNAIQLLVIPEESITGRLSLSIGPGRFLDPDATSLLVQAVVGRLDLFTLWVTALMVIGLSVMGGIPRARAVFGGVAAWVVGAILPLWGALRSG